MYECPSCAANLRYDIYKQMLSCDHCGNTVDPYAFEKERDAEERNDYEVTIFSCPQCGGELISDDTTAATFCSYCGASTILDSRISKEKKPKRIIPFRQTTEQCKAAYHKMLRGAIFAPDELKDPNHIDKFRGIYMPYWLYSYELKGPLLLKGRTQNSNVINYYDVHMEMDADYRDIPYDASSTFPDHVSASIGPFDNEDSKPFTPAFLSGFYADTNDVADWVYREDAEKLFRLDSSNYLFTQTDAEAYGVEDYFGMSVPSNMNPTSQKAELGLFPVWFLSYRNGDRVAYAVMNGQTGKMTAELPVDIKKYLGFSLLLAIPIFILLCFLPTMVPTQLLLLTAFLALLCGIIVNLQMSGAIAKDRYTDDKGQQYVETENPKSSPPAIMHNDFSIRRVWNFWTILLIAGAVIGIPVILMPDYTIPHIINHPIVLVIPLMIVAIYGLICLIQFLLKRKGMYTPAADTRSIWHGFGSDLKEKMPVIIKPILALITSILILLINPVEDTYYYLGAIVCMLAICWSITDMMKQYNRLTTRKLPQLNRRGGDENA